MQKHQNIYDNEVFFEKYKELRRTSDNYNILVEQPAMLNLLHDLTGQKVLDLGCGFGVNAMNFVEREAKSVVGID